jgi:hypothetical protein
MVVGYVRFHGSEIIGGISAGDQAAVDVTQTLKPIGIVLVPAETVSAEYAGFEPAVIQHAQANVIDAAKLHRAVAGAIASWRDNRKAANLGATTAAPPTCRSKDWAAAGPAAAASAAAVNRHTRR